ncbi:ATP-dependent helicase, partial [Mycolicibacterium elephantis]
VKPTITRFNGASHPVLHEIAPGERTFSKAFVATRPEPAAPQRPRRRRPSRRRRPAGAAS